MKRLLFLAMIFLGFVGNGAAADEGLVVGVGAGRLDVDDGVDLSFTLVQASVGYQFDVGETFTLTPEIRAGVGADDDTLLGVDIEVDSFYGVGLRAGIAAGNAYVYAYPTYTNYKLKASAAGVSASADDWDTGIGVGAGYNLTAGTSIEISYESIEDADIFALGLRFAF